MSATERCENHEPAVDGLRRCHNRCFFCFITGLPKGLRPALYLKDDDYRHSFLFGNFVTLTNLTEEDWSHLAEQRLSPLYVSVHSTEPALRRYLLGNPAAPEIMEQLRRLARLRIQVHAQVVLCPGVNDGVHLATTLDDLAALYPSVQSIAVVPVGVTRYNAGRDIGKAKTPLDAKATGSQLVSGGSAMRPFTSEESRAVLNLVGERQERHRASLGVDLVYLADEFYLRVGEPLPSGERYDEFPQYANGVGMARSFVDDWQAALRRKTAHRNRHLGSGFGSGRSRRLRATRHAFQESRGESGPRKIALVTGTLFAPVLRHLVDASMTELGLDSHPQLTVLPVENAFFGPTVTVAGLLTGADIMAAVSGHDYQLVILPRNILDAEGALTLDGYSPEILAKRIRTQVEFVSTPKEILALL